MAIHCPATLFSETTINVTTTTQEEANHEVINKSIQDLNVTTSTTSQQQVPHKTATSDDHVNGTITIPSTISLLSTPPPPPFDFDLPEPVQVLTHEDMQELGTFDLQLCSLPSLDLSSFISTSWEGDDDDDITNSSFSWSTPKIDQELYHIGATTYLEDHSLTLLKQFWFPGTDSFNSPEEWIEWGRSLVHSHNLGWLEIDQTRTPMETMKRTQDSRIMSEELCIGDDRFIELRKTILSSEVMERFGLGGGGGSGGGGKETAPEVGELKIYRLSLLGKEHVMSALKSRAEDRAIWMMNSELDIVSNGMKALQVGSSVGA